jgi:hypothetical protein
MAAVAILGRGEVVLWGAAHPPNALDALLEAAQWRSTDERRSGPAGEPMRGDEAKKACVKTLSQSWVGRRRPVRRVPVNLDRCRLPDQVPGDEPTPRAVSGLPRGPSEKGRPPFRGHPKEALAPRRRPPYPRVSDEDETSRSQDPPDLVHHTLLVAQAAENEGEQDPVDWLIWNLWYGRRRSIEDDERRNFILDPEPRTKFGKQHHIRVDRVDPAAWRCALNQFAGVKAYARTEVGDNLARTKVKAAEVPCRGD